MGNVIGRTKKYGSNNQSCNLRGGLKFADNTYDFPKGYVIAIGSKTLEEVHDLGGIPISIKFPSHNVAQYSNGTWSKSISGKQLVYVQQNGGSTGYVDHNISFGDWNLMVLFNCDWDTMKNLSNANLSGNWGNPTCTCWLQPKNGGNDGNNY